MKRRILLTLLVLSPLFWSSSAYTDDRVKPNDPARKTFEDWLETGAIVGARPGEVVPSQVSEFCAREPQRAVWICEAHLKTLNWPLYVRSFSPASVQRDKVEERLRRISGVLCRIDNEAARDVRSRIVASVAGSRILRHVSLDPWPDLQKALVRNKFLLDIRSLVSVGRRDPRVLAELAQDGSLSSEDMKRLILHAFVLAKAPGSKEMVLQFIKSTKYEVSKCYGQLLLLLAQGKTPDESYDKSTPEKLLSAVLGAMDEMRTDFARRHIEFWVTPGRLPEEYMEEQLKQVRDSVRRGEDIFSVLAQDVQRSLQLLEAGSAKVRTWETSDGDTVSCIYEGDKFLVALWQGMFGVWRMLEQNLEHHLK